MTNYAVVEYSTASALETAVEAIETTVTFDVITYRVGCNDHFLKITPAPNKTA